MPVLVLCRHGESEWNLQNRFTGWVDVDLTVEGQAQARLGGELLRAYRQHHNIDFSCAYTSVQKRAIRTLWLMLEVLDLCHLETVKHWRLNERHYGALTGLNKQETRDQYGDAQVHVWRRSFDTPPPLIARDNPYYPGHDARYAHLCAEDLPLGESLAMTLDRVSPYFESDILPNLRAQNNILISAHGNSLRALMKILFGVADTKIAHYEIPTGNPLCLELDVQKDALAKPFVQIIKARYLDETRAKPLPLF